MKNNTPKPAIENVYKNGDKPIVAKMPHINGDDVYTSISELIELLGGLDKSIKKGDKVLIKPNFNCSYATPLSTSLDFLSAVIELLLDFGVTVTVGELSGKSDWPTEKVVKNLDVMRVFKRLNVPFVNFEHDEWVPMDIPGEYWKTIKVPRTIYEAEKRIYLPNLRTHGTGGYSGALKLGVGWINLDDRAVLHSDKKMVAKKIPEVNLGWLPDLVIMDFRRTTTELYGRGNYEFPNCFLASGDMVAIDSEGVKTLQTFPADNKLSGVPLTELDQIKGGLKYNLGSVDYELREIKKKMGTDEDSNALLLK